MPHRIGISVSQLTFTVCIYEHTCIGHVRAIHVCMVCLPVLLRTLCREVLREAAGGSVSCWRCYRRCCLVLEVVLCFGCRMGCSLVLYGVGEGALSK